MLLLNKTKCPQAIKSKRKAIPSFIQPGMVVDSKNIDGEYLEEAFEEFEYSSFKNLESVGIVRTFALGDMILLIPAIRLFRKYYNIQKIDVYTESEFIPLLKYLFSDITFRHHGSLQQKTTNDVTYNLDHIVELDHSLTSEEHLLHRTHIYMKYLGIPLDYGKIDWTSDAQLIFGNESINLETNMKKIGLQLRGSRGNKTISHEYMKSIAKELAKKYKVVLIDSAKDKGFEGENIINTCGKLNTIQITAMLKKLDCCITMDSGILWLAHVANCPVITMFGPTREEERLTLHPQYPEKAKAIYLSKLAGCQTCFETYTYCKMKYNCMNKFKYEDLLAEILKNITQIVGE